MYYVEPIREKKKIEQIKSVLKKKGKRNLLLFIFGINCGLRISDILNLKVSDVKNVDYIEIREKKTNKNKKFPITNAYKQLINDYTKNRPDDDWLFKSRKGKLAITRIQAYRIINSACRKVGITYKVGTHTLRKTFGYHFYNETKDIALLQTLFNHSSPSVTLRYIGINQDIIDSNLKMFRL